MKKNEFLRGKPSSGNREQLFAIINKIVVFTLLFIGMWAGTQRFARLMKYHPAYVGQPFYQVSIERIGIENYPLYQPWDILFHLLQYSTKEGIWPYLRRALNPWIAISLGAIVLYTVLTYFRGFRQMAENIFGTARWARKKDLEKEGLLTGSGGVVCGQLFDAEVSAALNRESGSVSLHLVKPSQIISQIGITNILLAAPTRSGKGVSSVIPTLLSYRGSVIVLDFKGENFFKTSGFRQSFGKVYRYAPVGETGHHFNALMEIRGGKDAYGDANVFADVLTTPETGKAGGDANSEHFRETGMEFLTGLILHVLCSDYPQKSIPGIRDFVSQVNPQDPSDDTYIYKLMLEGKHCNEEVHRKVVSAAGNQMKRADRERQSVLSTVTKALRVFEDTRVRENSMDSDFYLDEFEKSDVPVSLYLTIPNAHRSRLSPLIRLFIMILINRFSEGETRHDDRRLKIPLLFVLDEFDKLGKYSELQTGMGILAGYGIHFFLIIQSPNQLVDIYGKNHQFFAHCKNSILYAPGEIESGKINSEMIGKESVWISNTSTSGNRFSVGLDNLNISGSERERNLINADEIMKLPPDQLVLLTQGKPPYIGKKCVYYEDPRFKDRLLKPAFTTRKGALQRCTHNKARTEGGRWFDLPLTAYLDEITEIETDERLADPWFDDGTEPAENRHEEPVRKEGGEGGSGQGDTPSVVGL
jgi:type IV secretion system protein VirD4